MNAVEREPVETRVLNPNASEASYDPEQCSYRKTKPRIFFFFFFGGILVGGILSWNHFQLPLLYQTYVAKLLHEEVGHELFLLVFDRLIQRILLHIIKFLFKGNILHKKNGFYLLNDMQTTPPPSPHLSNVSKSGFLSQKMYNVLKYIKKQFMIFKFFCWTKFFISSFCHQQIFQQPLFFIKFFRFKLVEFLYANIYIYFRSFYEKDLWKKKTLKKKNSEFFFLHFFFDQKETHLRGVWWSSCWHCRGCRGPGTCRWSHRQWCSALSPLVLKRTGEETQLCTESYWGRQTICTDAYWGKTHNLYWSVLKDETICTGAYWGRHNFFIESSAKN